MKTDTPKKICASTSQVRRIQCPYCIDALCGKVRLAYHINAKHPEKVEEWVKGDA